jgi:Zn-dependent M28 family amino/carboxypeptidase
MNSNIWAYLVAAKLAGCAVAAGAPAPAPGLAQDAATARVLEELAKAPRQGYDTLRYLCDHIGGRVSGTDSGRRAEEWAMDRFTAYGLPVVRYEPFRMPCWQNLSLEVDVIEPFTRRMYAVALGNTRSTPPEGVTAEVVDLGYGTPQEFAAAGDRVRGRFVLVKHGVPEGHREVHRVEKTTLAREAGAAGLILVHTAVGNLVQAGVCAIGDPSPIPAVSIPMEEGARISRLLAQNQRVVVRIRSQCESGEREVRNVVAEIPGTNPERASEIIVLGAHLDSWATGQGAVDNGTGTVAVLEAARLFVAAGIQPARTVRFVLFMGEELGLFGSKAYVQAHSTERIVLMWNLDMIGRPKGIILYGVDEAIPFFEDFARRNGPLGLSPQIANRIGLHSDHQPFLLAGIPTGTFDTELPPEALAYYHTAADTLERVPEDALAASAAAAAALIAAVANAEALPFGRIEPDTLRQRLERDGLREPLERENSWPFPEPPRPPEPQNHTTDPAPPPDE